MRLSANNCMIFVLFVLFGLNASILFSEDSSLEDLRRDAEIEAGKKEDKKEEKFVARGLGLQKLNPEISIVGDFLATLSDKDKGAGKTDFLFRTLGLHFESYLDPYTRFKAAVPVVEGNCSLGEAYMTRYGFGKNLNLTLGKFRQQFGVVNRWHKHGLDQHDFPLALRRIFGDGGLNQSGLSMDWNLQSSGRVSHEICLQLTDGENGRVFGENSKNKASVLLRYRNYRDINDSTYFEFGLSSLIGWNDS